MKRVTTGAYMMSAAHQSPNRKSPVPPKRARACAHSWRMRSISSRTGSLSSFGGKLLRTFIGSSRRRLAKPECISAAIERAIAARAFVLGPIERRPVAVGEELDDRQAVPHDAFAVPQDRHLAERRRELVAFAPLLPFVVEHRHDQFLELFARLLARRASRAWTSSNKRGCR